MIYRQVPMYTIQKHKATRYILDIFKGADVIIDYKNDIPVITFSGDIFIHGMKIHGNRDGSFSLNDIVFMHGFGLRFGVTDRIDTHITTNIFNIYNIPHTYEINSPSMYFPAICKTLNFYTSFDGPEETFCINDFEMVIPNSNNKLKHRMLMFMIDPLQTIKQLDHIPRDPAVQTFFDYYRNTIIEQDRNLLLKYCLITCLGDRLLIADIIDLIMDNIIELLLL